MFYFSFVDIHIYLNRREGALAATAGQCSTVERFILREYGYIYLRTYISWQGRCWGGIISTSTTCCGEWRK